MVVIQRKHIDGRTAQLSTLPGFWWTDFPFEAHVTNATFKMVTLAVIRRYGALLRDPLLLNDHGLQTYRKMWRSLSGVVKARVKRAPQQHVRSVEQTPWLFGRITRAAAALFATRIQVGRRAADV